MFDQLYRFYSGEKDAFDSAFRVGGGDGLEGTSVEEPAGGSADEVEYSADDDSVEFGENDDVSGVGSAVEFSESSSEDFVEYSDYVTGYVPPKVIP